MRLFIEEWEWDDDNIEHLARHGLTPELIQDEIWLEAPKYNANRAGRIASHIMVGPDRSGRLWTVCIVQSEEDPATWRAITGWPSKPQEENWYWRAR